MPFRAPAADLASTTIFARPGAPGRQWLAYSVRTHLLDRVNLVMPLPVPPGTTADDLRLLSLHNFPEFFAQLDHSFSRPNPKFVQTRGPSTRTAERSTMSTHALGEYSAIVAPTLDALASADEAIRPPAEMLMALRTYDEFAFLVLNLRPRRRRVINLRESLGNPEDHHAILIDFPTRYQGEIFMPMLSARNGVVTIEADYDHELYCQTTGNRQPQAGWEISSRLLGSLADPDRDFGAADANKKRVLKAYKGAPP